MSIRNWLRANGYQDIDDLISTVIAEFKSTGSKERRNWADVLSGGKDGKPAMIAGRVFPVLASAQESRGKQATPNAIRRNKHEEFPGVRKTGRWVEKSKLPSKLTTLSKGKGRKPSRGDAQAS